MVVAFSVGPTLTIHQMRPLSQINDVASLMWSNTGHGGTRISMIVFYNVDLRTIDLGGFAAASYRTASFNKYKCMVV